MLKRIKKGIKLEQVRFGSENVSAGGMIAHASFIIGLPGETKDTLQETEKFAKSMNTCMATIIYAVFPVQL